MRWLAARSLGWRLYAVGVAQLFVVVVAVAGSAMLFVRISMRGNMQAVVAALEPSADDPSALAKVCAALRRREHVLLTVYDDRGRAIVSNVEPVLPLPRWHSPGRAPHNPTQPSGPFAFGDGSKHRAGPHVPPVMMAAFDMGGRERWVVALFEPPRPSAWPLLIALLFGSMFVGTGTVLTLRWITRPLTLLASAARSLGEGDLRARARLERADEFGEVGIAFNEMAERVQSLLLAEKELLANVSHELRTPLARIRVALELAAEGDSETASRSLAEIAIDLAELETLIDDVLATTRLAVLDGPSAPGGFPLNREEIAPQVIAERSAERFRTRHPERPLSVEIQGLLPVFDADPVLVRRVIDNLLDNAHKYSRNAALPVVLRVAGDAEMITFEIADRGIGIPADQLSKVFQPFYRGDPSRARDTGGLGLGLTLAMRIVEAHGGTLKLTSAATHGTIAQARLPVRATH